jgi:hypothetical protein
MDGFVFKSMKEDDYPTTFYETGVPARDENEALELFRFNYPNLILTKGPEKNQRGPEMYHRIKVSDE